jgi:N-acetylglucosaminyl-diphospho-decaprenol L-rhamnosyltransferase
MSVLIVIVNYRCAERVIACLRSLAGEAASVAGLRTVVVDNDSGDGSCGRIEAAIAEEGFGGWASLMPLSDNGGFAAGNNAAIGAALSGGDSARHVMLLNPDTIVRSGAIAALASFLDAHPNAGIAGSVVEDETGCAEHCARRCPSPVGELLSAARTRALERLLGRWSDAPGPEAEESGRPQQCDWVSGAAMMVRRDVFETTGLLDEGYFLYFEELDFCERARRKGWEVWCVPQSRIVHAEGASTGIGVVSERRTPHWYASRRRFFIKRYGIAGWLCADALWAAGRLLRGARRALGDRPHTDIPRRMARDLLLGDAAALVRGEAGRIRRGPLPIAPPHDRGHGREGDLKREELRHA